MQGVFLATVLAGVVFFHGHTAKDRGFGDAVPVFGTQHKKTLAAIRASLEARSFGVAARTASNAAKQAGDKGERYAAALFSYYASRALGSGGAWGQAAAKAAECRRLAEQIGDARLISVCSFTLAGAYMVSNEMDLAAREAKAMLDHAEQSKPDVSIFTLASAIAANGGKTEDALRYSRRAVADASAKGSLEDLGFAYNERGVLYLRLGNNRLASEDLTESFRLRRMARSKHLGQSYHNLGRLLLAEGRFPEAGLMLRSAIAFPSPEASLLPWSYFRLAQASLGAGDKGRALEQARTSLGLMRLMRTEHPFGNELQVRSEARLQDVAEFFLDTSIQSMQRRPDPGLLQEAFSTVQEHRAASLALRAETSESWRRKLPEDYFAKLSKLRTLEAEAIRTRQSPGTELLSLRADLAAAETRSGLEAAAQHNATPAEHRARLDHALAKGETLVSFHLGTPRSYAFLLRDSVITVRELGSRDSIAAKVEQFRKSMEAGSGEAIQLGRVLYGELFGALPVDKAGGLLTIVPDDILYGLPFGALVVDEAGTYLARRYAIRLTPSAYFFGGRRQHPRPLKFAGVADPVFNKADPRWEGSLVSSLVESLIPARQSVQLARLIASDAEVRQAAALWSESRLLVGRQVGIEPIERAVREAPGILHVATHILRRAENVSPSIALGLDESGKLKVWTASDVAAMENAPEFVTLSGCGSGRGPALRGAGLLGLTRSWLMAGSRAVVVSYWPVPEESHRLFGTYYQALRDLEGEAASSRRAALALQRAQVEAMGRGGWQADPRYWAAYFVIGAL